MPHPLCPHCGNPIILDENTYRGYRGSITCNWCKGRFHIEISDPHASLSGIVEGHPKLISPPRPLGDPELLKGLTVPAVPQGVYADYQEACASLDGGNYRAAAVMCRTAVQRALLLKGIPDRKPEEMVNIARAKDVLSEMAYRQALAAVFIGGKAGHPQADWTDLVGSNDGRQALLVTRRILIELFLPGEIQP